MAGKRRAVFLDRDGVLIANVMVDGIAKSVACAEDVRILPGVADACAALKQAGFALVMVTNQPDAKRGRTPRAFVERTNCELCKLLKLDAAMVCWHDNDDCCDCRKPKPGLILQAADEYALDLSHSAMVGDRWRDVEAGKAAGCATVLIDYRQGEPLPSQPDRHALSLLAAVPWLLARLA